ncbi:UNVERIFIED_CONTAM: hypothetical protein FKN15_006787 [Acipenser sinensis]
MNVHDVGGRRRFEDSEFTLRIYPGTIAEGTIYCPVSARKSTTAAEVIDHLINKLQLDKIKCYVLAEVKEFGGEEWILNPTDCPVQRMMLWPRMALENRFSGEDYRFLLREKNLDGSIHYGNLQMWLRVTEERRRMVERGFLPQPQQKDYDDLCNLPDLNEKTLLDNLRSRFKQEKIYTYVGSILIVINPFKFLPIYNPKYVKMYDNHQLGKLEPHIYAVADVAYHAMLQQRNNQCIVISGESGSGKTQSTNFLIHHLTALSQKGFASGVEQIILGAGPVLESLPMVFMPVFSPIWNAQLFLSRFTAATPQRLGKRRLKHTSSEMCSCQSVIFRTADPQRSHQRPIMPEDTTDLNGSTADPEVPYQPQGSLVHGELWIVLPT